MGERTNILNLRRPLPKGQQSTATAAVCQKCLKPGHWTYECKNEAVYVSRPSRSTQLRDPKKQDRFAVEPPPAAPRIADQVKAEMKKWKREVKKMRKREGKDESSSSSSSSSDSDSDSSSSSASSSSSPSPAKSNDRAEPKRRSRSRSPVRRDRAGSARSKSPPRREERRRSRSRSPRDDKRR